MKPLPHDRSSMTRWRARVSEQELAGFRKRACVSRTRARSAAAEGPAAGNGGHHRAAQGHHFPHRRQTPSERCRWGCPNDSLENCQSLMRAFRQHPLSPYAKTDCETYKSSPHLADLDGKGLPGISVLTEEFRQDPGRAAASILQPPRSDPQSPRARCGVVES